jgi:hypothetical protein
MHVMSDLTYLPRLLTPLVTQALKTSPVVVVTGARQTGKSTLEVKSSKQPRLADCKSIAIFRQEYGKKALPGLVLHDGSETTWLADGVLATPWWRVI